MVGAPILTSNPATAREPARLAGVRRIIAVASGKGGVGKTTLSVNLSLALADAGFRVGLVDADLFGPSIPGMLGVPADAKPTISPDQKVLPVEAQGLRVMSMAMLTGDDAPAVMRGPMVTKYCSALHRRRRLGRARLSDPRPAPRHRRHTVDARAELSAHGRGDRDHAAGG